MNIRILTDSGKNSPNLEILKYAFCNLYRIRPKIRNYYFLLNMYYFPDERWYAIRVKYRHEAVAEKCLSQKALDPLLLSYQERSRRKDRYKILTKFFFPGYMFIKTTMDATKHVDILKSIGVVEVLRNSQGPIPIADEQIENVTRLKGYEGKVIVFNEFCCGMKVRLVEGPLAGLVGKIDEVRRDLLKVCVESIPGSVAIQVNPDQLEHVDEKRSLSELLRLEEKAV